MEEGHLRRSTKPRPPGVCARVGALGHNDSLRWQREGRVSKRWVFLSGGPLSGVFDVVSILSGTNNLRLETQR